MLAPCLEKNAERMNKPNTADEAELLESIEFLNSFPEEFLDATLPGCLEVWQKQKDIEESINKED